MISPTGQLTSGKPQIGKRNVCEVDRNSNLKLGQSHIWRKCRLEINGGETLKRAIRYEKQKFRSENSSTTKSQRRPRHDVGKADDVTFNDWHRVNTFAPRGSPSLKTFLVERIARQLGYYG